MKIRLNHPDRDKDGSLDHPAMGATQLHHYSIEDAHAQEAVADFPADVGNDLGQYSEDEGHTYPSFPDVANQAGGEDVLEAAQRGGSGPRVDDLGIDDLHDQPHEIDLEAIDEYVEDIGDKPMFDRSIENIEVETPTENIETGAEGVRLPEKIEQLAEEESEVYDVSMDGPGTRDLH